MQINDADVAELVDARDLKSLATTDSADTFGKTPASAPVETAAIPARLENNSEVDTRLRLALHDAGRSALGMPGTVDTFKAMLHRAGLMVVLA